MPKIVLFGATGFTGRLTAQALIKRGCQPLLAGRSQQKLDALVAQLGMKLETRVASSDDLASVRSLLDEGDVLITTVGPFTQHGDAALTAAISKRAHYFDSTGEPGFVRRVFTLDHEHAVTSNTLLITAFGYDYVPGHLAAGLALRAAGNSASRVDVGYFSSGSSAGARGYSQGTEHSSRLAALHPGLEFSGGRLIERYNAQRVREIEIDGRARAAFSLGGSEHYALPKDFPQLREINVYLGWFGKRSYAMSRGARALAAIRKVPVLSKLPELLVGLGPKSQGEGPDAETRARVGSRVVALTYDDAGNELSRVDLVGANAYDFTADILAWGAQQTLAGKARGVGARGPIEAFGLDQLRDGCAQAGLVTTE